MCLDNYSGVVLALTVSALIPASSQVWDSSATVVLWSCFVSRKTKTEKSIKMLQAITEKKGIDSMLWSLLDFEIFAIVLVTSKYI